MILEKLINDCPMVKRLQMEFWTQPSYFTCTIKTRYAYEKLIGFKLQCLYKRPRKFYKGSNRAILLTHKKKGSKNNWIEWYSKLKFWTDFQLENLSADSV